MNIDNYIIKSSKINHLLKLNINNKLKKYNFCVVRGLFDKKKIIKSKKKIFKKFSSKVDRKSKLNPSKNSFEIRLPQKKDNVKKKVIEIFNPYHDKDIFSLKFFFNKLVLIRNMMLRLNFNKKNLKEYNHNGSKFFTSNRIMFYTNGGFIDEHKDNNAAKFTIAKFGKYYQVILSLTKKNEDFYAGGAYVYYKKKINLDDYMDYGDVLIYNEKIIHGVDKIKSKNLRYSGKISVLVTFYKNLEKN